MRAWWRSSTLSWTVSVDGVSTSLSSSGPLVEMILEAVALPADLQPDAWIDVDGQGSQDRLFWPQILAMSKLPDLPMII